MSTYSENSKFKRLCNDVKEKLLIFQDIKGSLECGLLGSAGSKKLRGSFLSCGGWVQPGGNRNSSYTESLTAGLDTLLRWQAWEKLTRFLATHCGSGEREKGSGTFQEVWASAKRILVHLEESCAWKDLQSWAGDNPAETNMSQNVTDI